MIERRFFQVIAALVAGAALAFTSGVLVPFDDAVPAALAGPAAAPDNSLRLQPLVTSGLTRPLFVTHSGDGSDRLFIVEQGGLIKVFSNGQILGPPFLDLTSAVVSSNEQGLLGIAFHPNYRTNGRFFVSYTAKVTPSTVGVGDNVLAEYRASPPGASQAIATPTRVLFSLSDPYTNHNGGDLHFGPDGYLYVGTGDGGSGGDPENRAQNPQSLFGKMLRLDVDNIPNGQTYGIPPTNPFVGQAGKLAEIWALGLRNPWRWGFDRGASATDPNRGALFIGDVGQGVWEEINRAPPGVAGLNYGWRIREGAHCFNPATGCTTAGLVDPILEYDHSLGCAVVGGFVYRGAANPSLQGAYLYADACSGRVWKARPQGASWTSTEALDTALSPSSFGEDEAGEMYLVDLRGGLYRVGVAGTGTVGGKGLGVSVNFPAPTGGPVLDLSWSGGDLQGGYFLYDVANNNGSWLNAGVTSVQVPLGQSLSCYVLLPMTSDQQTILGQSDFLCGQTPGVAPPAPSPANFALRLNQSATSSLTWVNAPGTVASILVAFPTDGSPERYQLLTANETQAIDATGGSFTCYLLVNGLSTGYSYAGLICGLPGASAFPADASAAARNTGTTASARSTGATDVARATAKGRFGRHEQRIRPQMERLGPKMQGALQEAKQRLDRARGRR